MKKILLAVAALSFCMSTYATDWTVEAVPGDNNEVIGHIAFTNAVGRRANTEKMFTSLRMVCSVAPTGDKAPYVVLFWNEMNTVPATKIGIRVDDTVFFEQWGADKPIVFTGLSRLSPLMAALSTGKVVGFEWRDSQNTVFRTAFSLSGFSAAMDDFYKRCGL